MGPISDLERYSRTASQAGTTTPMVAAAAAARAMKTGNPLTNRAQRQHDDVRRGPQVQRAQEAVATVTVVRGR